MEKDIILQELDPKIRKYAMIMQLSGDERISKAWKQVVETKSLMEAYDLIRHNLNDQEILRFRDYMDREMGDKIPAKSNVYAPSEKGKGLEMGSNIDYKAEWRLETIKRLKSK